MDPRWNEMTVSALKQKCEERGLSKTGLKADILNRIREHDERFRPREQPQLQHSDFTPARDDPRNVRGRGNSTPRRSEGSTRRDQERPDHSRADSTGRLTEAELERILRDNYLPRENDQDGRERRKSILKDDSVKYEEAKNKRDEAITKAEAKFAKDKAKLDKEKAHKLDQLDKEVAPKLEKRRNWGPAFRELEMLRKARGLRPPDPKAFAPRHQVMNETSPPAPSRPQSSDKTSVASSFNTAPSFLPSGIKRKASDTPLASSLTDPPSFRLRTMEDPFSTTPRGPSTELVVESAEIKSQLVNNPYIFLAARNIWLQLANLPRMKSMVENAHFSPKHVRADQTGYFIVFESSVQGDSQAALCFEHFQGEKFNGDSMNLVLHRRDR